jgi:predicted phage terminase large subunit-like protein
MTEIPEYIQREAEKELARRIFYNYCQYRFPKLYKDDRKYLKTVCDKIQWFVEQNEKRFLVINLPPRFLKSLTGTNLVEWLFGLNNLLKVMTGSYNETLSTTFARKVRDTIDEQPSKGVEVYNNLFPKTKIKYGQASKSLWALEGSGQDNYLATSPTGTATGFGANYIIIDDIIKNATEAYNQMVLDSHWDWLTNTMLSRTEGDDWKVIAIMTRWAKDDLAGRIIDKFGELVEVITFKAVQDDGSMLCEEILTKEDYTIKTQEMNHDIVEANYNQVPIDIKGRLYDTFKEYDSLPEDAKRWNYTDTADKGTDWLCSVDYDEKDGEIYITDVVMSDEAMEFTEPQVAQMFHIDGVVEAIIESNNGGRGFGRNIQRLLRDDYGNTKVTITEKNQTANKEARILTSSAWCKNHIHMPHGWKNKWPDFYDQLMEYQTKGKNLHDDAPDVLAGIYDNTNQPVVTWAKAR